jgi:hypothetical protein
MRLRRIASGSEGATMLHNTTGHLTTIMWDSVMEPTDTAKAMPWAIKYNGDYGKQVVTSGDRGESWYGAPSFDVLQQRLRDGWSEGSERLLKIATRDINPQSIRRRRERADQGAELDIHAVYRGDLSRAWTRTRRRSGSGVRSVSIVIDLGAHCGVGADQLFWRGASALKLATALTESGYSVAIYGAASAKRADEGDTVNTVQFVGIKDEDQPLDLDRLAALTAMPGFFRTSLFSGIARACDLRGKRHDGGLGTPAPELIRSAIKTLPVPQNAFIQKPVLDKESAEAWIDEVLNSLEQTESVPA